VLGERDNIHWSACGVPEANFVCVLLRREVPCGIRDVAGMITRDSISSPNVDGACAAAASSVCRLMTNGTIDSVLQ